MNINTLRRLKGSSILHPCRRDSSTQHGRQRDRSIPHGCVVLCSLAALLVVVFIFSGCAARGGHVIGKQPIKNVIAVENDIGALKAWTVNKAKAAVLIHIGPTDGMTVFPPNYMQDMKNAAAHLKRRNEKVLDQIVPLIERGGVVNLGYMAGMYKRVIWVVPSPRPASETSPDIYRDYFLKQRKFPEIAVGEFRARGDQIVGFVAGIPLTITRLSDLSLDKKENAIIDINIAYFPSRQREDATYRPGTKALLDFLREFATKDIKARMVTVNLASQSGLVSMDLRFLGREIREALAEPNILSGQTPERWQMMIEAEDSLRARKYEAAAALYNSIITNVKDDPGVYFSLAIALGFQNKGPECRTALLNAYALDSEYLRGFFQLARILGDAGKVTAGSDILDTPDLAKILAPLELDYQKGVFYYSAHRPFDAITYLERVTIEHEKDFGLYTILFRAYREAGDVKGQIRSLRQLIAIDDGRVRREMPWVYADLGQLYEKADSSVSAAGMYEKYMQVYPGDSLSSVFRKKIKAWSGKESGKSKR